MRDPEYMKRWAIHGCRAGRYRGSILVLTLWVVFFLSLLAVAIHVHVASGLNTALYLRNAGVAGWSAASGVERALAAVAGGSNRWDGLMHDAEAFHDVAVGSGCVSVYYTRVAGADGLTTNWGVVGEEGKINLSKASQPLLQALLSQPGLAVDGGISPSEMAACIVDWRDPDDDMLTGGAEGSYYRGLTGSYPCHNGDFQCLHELLLVKGVSASLFERISPYVTVYGTGKVNINVADGVVLRAVADAAGVGGPEARDAVTGKIMRFRDAGNAFREATAPAIIGALEQFLSLAAEERVVLSGMMPMITIRSTCFGGISEGHSSGPGSASQADRPGSVDMVRRVGFVLNAQTGTVVYWYEY